MTVAMNDFARRQTDISAYSYYDGTEAELIALVAAHMKEPKEGTGILSVPVPAKDFYSSVIELEEGADLMGKYEPRRKGELPTKTMHAVEGEKMPAKMVHVILYSHAALAEDGDNSTDADWEIVSINAEHGGKESPKTPESLMRDYYREEGGTALEVSVQAFVKLLKVSRDYWRNKAMLKEVRGEISLRQGEGRLHWNTERSGARPWGHTSARSSGRPSAPGGRSKPLMRR